MTCSKIVFVDDDDDVVAAAAVVLPVQNYHLNYHNILWEEDHSPQFVLPPVPFDTAAAVVVYLSQ